MVPRCLDEGELSMRGTQLETASRYILLIQPVFFDPSAARAIDRALAAQPLSLQSEIRNKHYPTHHH